MASNAESILRDLHLVGEERARRKADIALGQRVLAVKAYQQRRFSQTYDDMLRHPRYQAAARYFLDELYGPADFAQRDAQFARVVPAMVRLFPEDIIATVATLAALHALSERLDTQLAACLDGVELDAARYVAAWQRNGQPEARERQVELTVTIGERLDRLTRNPLLRQSLRMMRGPAKAAGLSELQRFLEAGFDTFREMRGAQDFLAQIGQRERRLATVLFAAEPPYDGADVREQLP